MTRGSGGYIFYANIEPSRFSNQWLDLGIGKSGVRQLSTTSAKLTSCLIVHIKVLHTAF